MSRRKEPSIPSDILDQLLAGTDAAAALSQGGLLDSLKKAFAERALNAEMDHHLGRDDQVGNNRNGYGRKTVTTDSGRIEIEVPRDRAGSFDPQLIAKYQRRVPGFDDKIISMYARGMSTRKITGHLRELYGIDASPDLISTIADAAVEQAMVEMGWMDAHQSIGPRIGIDQWQAVADLVLVRIQLENMALRRLEADAFAAMIMFAGRNGLDRDAELADAICQQQLSFRAAHAKAVIVHAGGIGFAQHHRMMVMLVPALEIDAALLVTSGFDEADDILVEVIATDAL